MIYISVNKIIFFLYSILLIILLLFASDQFTIDWAHLLFFVQLAFALIISKDFESKWSFFLSPSFLLVLYVNLNIFLGAYSLKENLLLEMYQHRSTSYSLIRNINIPYAYIALCSLISMIMLPKFKIPKKIKSDNSKHSFKIILLCLVLVLIFSIIKIDLAFIGGSGDFSTIPKSLASIILFYELSKKKYKYRFYIYTMVLFIFMITNFESKREAVFMIIPIVLLENIFGNLKTFNFSLKKTFVSLVSLIVLIYSLLIMTILRGFGEYEISNPINAYKYVDDLFRDFNIAGLLFTISEAPTTTYVSIKAMSLLNNDFEFLAYGSTYLKLLFVPIPRSIYSEKPLSMTSIFTKIEDPGFYGDGGSLPINIYAESFWNFHFGGIIIIVLIIFLVNLMYSKMIEIILRNKFSVYLAGIIFAYTYLLGFYRGFGFDLYFVNVLIGLFFSILISGLINLLLNIEPMFNRP